MPVNKEQSVSSSFTQGESAPQEDAAISSEYHRESTVAQQFPNSVCEKKTVVANLLGVPYPDRRIDGAGIGPGNYDTGIFGPQPLKDPVRSEDARHVLYARLLPRRGRLESKVGGSIQNRQMAMRSFLHCKSRALKRTYGRCETTQKYTTRILRSNRYSHRSRISCFSIAIDTWTLPTRGLH
jgi:hypothetical protein